MTGSERRHPATARVFFALWPDAAVQAALHRHGQALQRVMGGKLTRVDSVHLTLLFLGNVPESALAAVHRIGDEVRFSPFSIQIDMARCWRDHDIAWVGPSRMPAQLPAIVEQLRSGASAAGFEFESRPYAAHVTLVRKVRSKPVDIGPVSVEWPVSEFVLVRSRPDPEGSRYQVIARWPASE